MKSASLTTFLFLLNANCSWGKQSMLSAKKLATPPYQIIRPCCSFWVEMKMIGIPSFYLTEMKGINVLISNRIKYQIFRAERKKVLK